MSVESSKTLGGVGALLMVVGFAGFFWTFYSGFLLVVGAILVLIALKGLADQYGESGIFNNALYGFLTVIAGAVIAVAIFVMLALQALSAIDFTNPAAVQQYFSDLNNVFSLLGGLAGAYIVFFIFLIVSAVLFRKSLNSLSAKSGEKMFGTAGLLWLIGAVLSIVLVGFLLIWISWILTAVGFFSIKPAAATPQPLQPSP